MGCQNGYKIKDQIPSIIMDYSLEIIFAYTLKIDEFIPAVLCPQHFIIIHFIISE